MQHRLVTTRPRQLRQALPVLGLAGLAWLVMIFLSAAGDGAVIRHDRLLQSGPPLWAATILFVLGWQVMLLAMMVPASLHAFARFETDRSIALFGLGFMAVWTVFGLAVFFFDAGIHATVNHWPWLASHSWLIAGTTLVVTGTYQLSDLKSRSLVACRRLRHRAGNSVAEGAIHGLNCVGASGALMLLAFALGAGSLVTMAAITLLMAYEVTPWGVGVIKTVGYALVALGVIVMAGPVQAPLWWPT